MVFFLARRFSTVSVLSLCYVSIFAVTVDVRIVSSCAFSARWRHGAPGWAFGRGFPSPRAPDNSPPAQIDTSPSDNVLLVTPVRATPVAALEGTIPLDVPAVRMFFHPAGNTIAVYPLSREELGEVWTSPDQLAEWNLVPLPKLWVGAERVFQQLIDYPFEYLQALITVLRTQQFFNGSPLTPLTWSRACKRPSSLVAVDKTCSACDTVRTFAIRTLFTAPSRFPEWKCEQFGYECNIESEEPVSTVAPERWVASSPSTTPAASFVTAKRESPEPRVSGSPPVRSPEPGAHASPAPRLHESFRIDTPILPTTTPHRGQEGAPTPLPRTPSERGQHPDSLTGAPLPSHSYRTWAQIPAERRTATQSTSLITHGTSALRRATPSHYMIGDPLLRMTQPDPTPDQVAEYAREIHSAQWRGLRKDLDKWTPRARQRYSRRRGLR